MDHAADRVDLALGTHDSSPPLVRRSGEGRPKCDPRTVLDRGASIREREVKVGELFVWQRQADLGDVDRVDRGDRCADRDELSDVDVLAAHTSDIRRLDICAFKVSLGSNESRLGRRNRRLRVFELWLSERQRAWVAPAERLPLP